MRQALSDWKARQAGDEPLPAPPPKAPGMAITTHYVGRPVWCSGGIYATGRYEGGRPVILKQSKCDGAADWRTGLCEECQRRESDARQRMRDAAQGNGGRSGGFE